MAEFARRVGAWPEWPLTAGAVLGSGAVVEAVLRMGSAGGRLSAALLLAVAGTVPVALARAQLAVAASIITAAVLLNLLLFGWLSVAALLAQLAVLYLLGARGRGWAAMAVAGLLVAQAFAGAFGAASSEPVGGAGPGPATGESGGPSWASIVVAQLAVAAAGLGWFRRVRGETAHRYVSDRAVADSLLEHAARGERARIARELHDVVAHHISMIAVQAETARLTTPGMPVDGARRLLAIGDTARTALTEMRRLLGVLREDAAPEPTRRPQPGLEELNELIDEMRDSAGTTTRLIVSGAFVPLDSGVQLTAYRIVQEALSNARRHAPGAAVDVELHYAPGEVRIRVRDNGAGPPSGAIDANGGHGLLGMRERAATVGGTLRVGPAHGGGFLVEAVLPAPREDAR